MSLSGLGEIFDFGSKLLDKFIPDPAAAAQAKIDLFKLQQNGELAQLAADTDLIKGQLSINEEEAKNPNVFVAGPRPFLMWVGGFGAAYQWIVVPFFSFAYTLYTGHPLPVVPPVIDPNLMWMLGSLMGLHIGARSWEKVKGVAS